jgi:CheY-like chemotaxis protein
MKSASALPLHRDGHEGLRILVVEDCLDSAESLATLLRLYGHRVVIAFNGIAALEAVQKAVHDVVLLDIGLPELNGWEVARRISELSPQGLPPLLVAMTGYGQARDRERSLEAGIHLHLVKPVPKSFGHFWPTGRPTSPVAPVREWLSSTHLVGLL